MTRQTTWRMTFGNTSLAIRFQRIRLPLHTERTSSPDVTGSPPRWPWQFYAGLRWALSGSSRELRNSQQARKEAEQNLRRANDAQSQINQAKRQLEETMYSELINSAQRAAAVNRSNRARELLNKTAPRLRGWEWEFVNNEIRNSKGGLLRQSGLASVSRIDTESIWVLDGLYACQWHGGNS